MALLGGGVNQKEVREDRGVSQATGESGPSCPKSSAPGSTSTSTGWNAGPAVSETIRQAGKAA